MGRLLFGLEGGDPRRRGELSTDAGAGKPIGGPVRSDTGRTADFVDSPRGNFEGAAAGSAGFARGCFLAVGIATRSGNHPGRGWGASVLGATGAKWVATRDEYIGKGPCAALWQRQGFFIYRKVCREADLDPKNRRFLQSSRNATFFDKTKFNYILTDQKRNCIIMTKQIVKIKE